MNRHISWSLITLSVALLTLSQVGCKARKAQTVAPIPPIELPQCEISDIEYPKPETPRGRMRGVWLTTIWGLDWPKTSAHTPGGVEEQKRSLVRMLDQFVELGINTVFLQTRMRGDLLYPNGIEPISSTISGTGVLPSGYDPLQFAIDECHKRGMSVHAWMVVYPLGTNDHVQTLAKQGKGFWYNHRNLCIRQGNAWFMNPAEPAVRSYMGRLVREVVTRYDIDGVHLDYIRYPDGAGSFDDQKSFQLNNAKRLSKAQWREENISAMLDTLHQVLAQTAPEVALSTASIGKYRKLPAPAPGGFFCKDDVSQDPKAWFQRGIVDFIVPMIYYKGDHFDYYIRDWDKTVAPYGSIIPGLGAYRLHDNSRWKMQDIVNQLDTMARYKMDGVCFYRAENLIKMKSQLPQKIKNEIFFPAKRPIYGQAPREGFGTVVLNKLKKSAGSHDIQVNWIYNASEAQHARQTFNVYYRVYGPHLDCPLQMLAQSVSGNGITIDDRYLPKDVLVEFFVEPTVFSGHCGKLSNGQLYDTTAKAK